MNMSDLQSLLGALGSSPNWQYQLGLGQNQNQGSQVASNYLLGQGQNQNQAAQIANDLTLGQGQLGLGTLQANQNYTLGDKSLNNQFSLGNKQADNQLDEFIKSLGLNSDAQKFQQQEQLKQSDFTNSPAYRMAVLNNMNEPSRAGTSGTQATPMGVIDPRNSDILTTSSGRVYGGSNYNPSAMSDLYYWMAHGH